MLKDSGESWPPKKSGFGRWWWAATGGDWGPTQAGGPGASHRGVRAPSWETAWGTGHWWALVGTEVYLKSQSRPAGSRSAQCSGRGRLGRLWYFLGSSQARMGQVLQKELEKQVHTKSKDSDLRTATVESFIEIRKALLSRPPPPPSKLPARTGRRGRGRPARPFGHAAVHSVFPRSLSFCPSRSSSKVAMAAASPLFPPAV